MELKSTCWTWNQSDVGNSFALPYMQGTHNKSHIFMSIIMNFEMPKPFFIPELIIHVSVLLTVFGRGGNFLNVFFSVTDSNPATLFATIAMLTAPTKWLLLS